jgi:hypothetical protein
VNFASVIANHNLSHKRETIPGVKSIDTGYIRTLGPHVIPAVDRYIARKHLTALDCLVQWRSRIAATYTEHMKDWRAWTFRDLRLQHYRAERMDGKSAASATIEQPIIPWETGVAHRIFVVDDDPHIREVICLPSKKAAWQPQSLGMAGRRSTVFERSART